MKLAYSTNAYTRTTLDLAIDRIAALGYDGVEILCDQPHWFATRVDVAHAERTARRLADRGVGVSNLNANTANGFFDPPPPENVFEPALSNADADVRRRRVDYTIRAMELAKVVGAGAVSVTSGRPTPGTPPDRALDDFVDSLCRVCDAAARLDVRVGIEYEPGLLVERATELAEVMRRVDSDHLGANLDIGHSWLDGEAPEEAVGLLAGRIWNVHVEDILGRKHYHLVPGDGDLPFNRYFAALAAAGYDGYLTVELYTCADAPDEAGERSLAFLRRTLANTGADA